MVDSMESYLKSDHIQQTCTAATCQNPFQAAPDTSAFGLLWNGLIIHGMHVHLSLENMIFIR